ncbi:MAG TPA: hypothetical protein PKD54_08110 [Pirellulaceae bacterium]|nr:hypothetical protein [Pirellulaceae bacterium]
MTGLSKFLLFAFIAVVFVLGSLWLVGGKPRDYVAEVLIDSQPADVFPFLYEPALRKKWVDGLRESKLQTDPPIQLESVFLSKIERADSSFEAEETIIRFDDQEMVVIRSNTPAALVTLVVRIEKAGDKTRVSYSVNEVLHGITRFQAAIGKSTRQDQINQEILALKQAVETRPNRSSMLDDLDLLGDDDKSVDDGDDDE